MATLSKHGRELGRVNGIGAVFSIREDGHILINRGTGWKLYKKCRPGVDPSIVAEQAIRQFQDRLDSRPGMAEYLKALHDAAPMSKWNQLHLLVQTLPDDPDGVWAEANDMLGIHLDYSEADELCSLYGAYYRSCQRAKENGQAKEAVNGQSSIEESTHD